MASTGTQRNGRRTISLMVTFLALPLYVLACCSSAAVRASTVSFGRSPPPVETLGGGVVLLFGWFPPYTLAWSANILFLVAVILLCVGWVRAAFIWSSLAVLSSLTAWLYVAFGGVSELLGGYYLWQGSLLVFALGTWMIKSTLGHSDKAAAT